MSVLTNSYMDDIPFHSANIHDGAQEAHRKFRTVTQ